MKERERDERDGESGRPRQRERRANRRQELETDDRRGTNTNRERLKVGTAQGFRKNASTPRATEAPTFPWFSTGTLNPLSLPLSNRHSRGSEGLNAKTPL